MAITRAEQETIIRWDQERHIAVLFTSTPLEARKWSQLGYEVAVCGRTPAGEARGWRAEAPRDAVRLRKMEHGQLVRRRRGRSFVSRKLAEATHQPVSKAPGAKHGQSLT
jgi:hypothetical protein